MKSIKEKQMLVKWAKAMNEPVDPAILEEVENYEKLINSVKASVRTNLAEDLKIAASKVPTETPPVNIVENKTYDLPPTLDEVMSLFEETVENITEEIVKEEPKIVLDNTSIIDQVVSKISEEEVKNKDSFQQPNPDPVDRNLVDIQRKLKFLEQAIGRIAAHGPGSGETRFLNLDDVNKASFADRDRHKILKYNPNSNPAYDGVSFGFLTGDQGPIYSLKYDVNSNYTANADYGPGLTYYDSDRDTLEILHKDGSATYTGLDSYIRVSNNGSGGNISRGEFLVFTGVEQANVVPYVGKFKADANAIPLYSVGVAATDMTSNERGRAIVLGEIENLDTTGNVVGETWYAGNILWASPSTPGKLTVVQPTAPNVAISVAAVLKSDPTEGRLLVRPVIWPRLYYGSFASTQVQVAPNTTSGHAVTFNRTEFASGFVIENNSHIKALHAGLYNFQFSIQLTSNNAAAKTVYIWIRKNGNNVEDTATAVSVIGNGVHVVPAWNFVVSMEVNDYFQLFWSTSDTGAFIGQPTKPAFAPNIPPVLLSVTQAAL